MTHISYERRIELLNEIKRLLTETNEEYQNDKKYISAYQLFRVIEAKWNEYDGLEKELLNSLNCSNVKVSFNYDKNDLEFLIVRVSKRRIVFSKEDDDLYIKYTDSLEDIATSFLQNYGNEISNSYDKYIGYRDFVTLNHHMEPINTSFAVDFQKENMTIFSSNDKKVDFSLEVYPKLVEEYKYKYACNSHQIIREIYGK